MPSPRTTQPCQSDSSEEAWGFVAPCLSLLPQEATRRRQDLRRVFDAVKWIAWTGARWRALPRDCTPWAIAYQQAMRWLGAGVFAAMVHDLRVLLRDFAGRRSIPPPPFSTAARCNSPPRAGLVPGMRRPSASGVRSCVWRSIRWAICRRRTSPGQRTRPRPGRTACRGGAGGDRRECRDRLCRSGLYRRDAGRGGGSARHPVGRDQAPRGPAWLCAAAVALGGSGPSPGPPASAASLATLSVSQPSSPASLSSPSLARW